MTSLINSFKLMSYLKAHIFVSFHCFLQVFFTKKIQYSVFTSVTIDITIYCSRIASLFTVSFRHYLFTMVFSKEDKIIIQDDYEEKGWSAYKIWKDHSSSDWSYTSVKRLLKRFKHSGTMNTKEGSGRPRSVTIEENTDLIEELICSQKEAPHTHLAPPKTAGQTGISRSSLRRMIKRRNFRQLNRVKTPQRIIGAAIQDKVAP